MTTATLVRSSIGRKILVAVTGLGMVGFLIGHMIGNLRAYEGADAVNEYAELLRFEPTLLWAFRLGLLAFVVIHVVLTIQLRRENRLARPSRYAVSATVEASAASKVMLYGGIAIFLYVVYHILHLTVRSVHPELVGNTYTTGGHAHVDVYRNVVESFQSPIISGVYILAQVALFFHLQHGILSAARTLGVSHPRYVRWARNGGRALSAIIVLGFLAVPIGVLAGWIR